MTNIRYFDKIASNENDIDWNCHQLVDKYIERYILLYLFDFFKANRARK